VPSPPPPAPLLPFLVALLVAGVSQAIISTPLNLYWLQLLSFAPALVVLSKAEGHRAWLGGWLLGASANAAIFAWLVPTVGRFTTLGEFGGLSVLLLFAAAFGFYGAVFGWGAAAVRRASGRLWPLGLAAWFVACEFLNPQLFPYYQGVAWYQVPRVFLVSAVTGVPGVTFGVIALNGLLAVGWETWRGSVPREQSLATLRRSGAVLTALLLVGLGYAQVRHTEVSRAMATSESRRFALIQTNVDVPAMRALFREDRNAYRENLLALTREALADDPDIDIVVWPEGAIRGRLDHPRRAAVLELAKEHEVTIWTGAVGSRGPKGALTRHNGGFIISPDGRVSEPYDKNILVPFGEYMPLVSVLPFLGKIRAFPSVSPGESPAVLESPNVAGVGFLVCYEATRPRYLRAQVREGARFLSTVTFDGWFGDTAALDQHMMLAATMSAAMGLPQVRAATTGISMATGADGVLLGRTDRAARTWLAVDVPLAALPSAYARLGDWFAWLCILAGFVLACSGPRRPHGGLPTRLLRHLVPLAFLSAAPVAWFINPHSPMLDSLVWGAAVLITLRAALRK